MIRLGSEQGKGFLFLFCFFFFFFLRSSSGQYSSNTQRLAADGSLLLSVIFKKAEKGSGGGVGDGR